MKHARGWTPQNPEKEVPVSLLRPPGHTKFKPKTRHPHAAVWYHIAKDGKTEHIYPLVFTRDTAGTWWPEIDELWKLTNGELTDADEAEGCCTFDILVLLRKITEHIEQGNFPDDETCVGTMDDLHETLEQLR